MTGQPGELTADEQLKLGAMIVRARAHGVRWKDLEKRHGRTARQLRRYAIRARRAHPKMSAFSSKMSAFRDGPTLLTSANLATY